MKTLRKSIDLFINQPTKLFLEDLETIYSNINEISDNIIIRDNDFEFKDLQDLQEIKISELKVLKFFGYKNNSLQFMLFIYPKSINIKTESDELIVLGVIEKIKKVIDSKKRPLLLTSKKIIVFSMISMSIIIPALVLQNLLPDKLLFSRILIGISLFISINSWIQIFFAKNQIVLKYSRHVPSFWKKNSDKIIIAVFSSLFSFLLGLLVTWLSCSTP